MIPEKESIQFIPPGVSGRISIWVFQSPKEKVTWGRETTQLPWNAVVLSFFSVSSFPVAKNECLQFFLQLLTRDSGYESQVDRKWCDWYTDYTYIYIYTYLHRWIHVYIYICISISPFPSCKIYPTPFSMLFLILPKSVVYILWKKRLDRVFLGPTLVHIQGLALHPFGFLLAVSFSDRQVPRNLQKIWRDRHVQICWLNHHLDKSDENGCLKDDLFTYWKLWSHVSGWHMNAYNRWCLWITLSYLWGTPQVN